MTAVPSTAPTSAATLDAVALQLAQVKPETLYEEATLFDDAARQLADVTDRFRAVLRCLEEAWRCYEADGVAPALGTRSADVLNLLGELQSQDSGSLLRTAGDSLARAQAQIHDLQLRRMQDQPTAAASAPTGRSPYDEEAWLVLDRVSEDFVEVGANLLDLPERTATGSIVATAGAAPPAPKLSLASASFLADDGLPSTSRLPDPPGAASPMSASWFDSAGPPPPPGGQPMMPMMPMGMGMGMGGQATARERRVDSHATADPEAWRESDEGWDVLGRRRPPPPSPERVALEAIDALVRQGSPYR